MRADGEPLVLAAWPRTLLRALEHGGVDVRAVVRDAGIDPSELADSERRIPRSAETQLWDAAYRLTGNDALGIDVSRFTTPSSFHGISQAYLTSTTLRGALDRIARFARVTTDDSVVVTREVDGEFVYVSGWESSESPRPSPMAMVATIAALVRGARAMHGRDVSPTRVELLQAKPQQVSRFEQFFRCPIRFGADEYLVAFSLDVVDRPVPGSNRRLAEAAEAAMVEYLGTLDRSDVPSVASDVRNVLVDVIAAGDPDMRAVAAELAMSGRTLQRRLGDEGTTFRDVLAGTRVELAAALLRNSNRSITEIGRRVGFSEPAAFTRAFRRWTGRTPTAFRAEPSDAGLQE